MSSHSPLSLVTSRRPATLPGVGKGTLVGIGVGTRPAPGEVAAVRCHHPGAGDASDRFSCEDVTATHRAAVRSSGRCRARRAEPDSETRYLHAPPQARVRSGTSCSASVYAGKDLLTALPSHRCPEDAMRPGDAFQAISDELMLDGNARQNLATFCQTWEEEEVHGLMDLCHQQEPDRQGRVPPDRRDRAAVRADPGRPVERPRGRWGRRVLGHRVLRGLHARRHGRQVAVAGQAPGRGQADRQAQHGVRPGPGGVAQVRQVLGHRDAGDPHVAGEVLHGRRSRCWPRWTRTPSWWCPPSG